MLSAPRKAPVGMEEGICEATSQENDHPHSEQNTIRDEESTCKQLRCEMWRSWAVRGKGLRSVVPGWWGYGAPPPVTPHLPACRRPSHEAVPAFELCPNTDLCLWIFFFMRLQPSLGIFANKLQGILSFRGQRVDSALPRGAGQAAKGEQESLPPRL